MYKLFPQEVCTSEKKRWASLQTKKALERVQLSAPPPGVDPDHLQNIIICFLSHFLKTSSISLHNFLNDVAYRQLKQTLPSCRL